MPEGKASLPDSANRQEDRFANIFQARTESATGRVMENAGPLRPQIIIPQVVEGASNLLRSGSGRVVITLHPPQLGTIDMDIRVRDNKVSMLMLADNHEVKQVLESSLTQLKNALSEQGLQVDRLDVLVQDRSGNEFAGLMHERGSSAEGRGQAEQGGQNARAADANSGEVRRSMDTDEPRLVNVFV
jgi:flagellar hook-length control protein FliK